MPAKEAQLILDSSRAHQKIRRIAYEIYENNYKREEIVLAGIRDGGYSIAVMLQKILKEISDLQIHLIAITIDKEKPHLTPAVIEGEISQLKGKTIIVVDDVGNSGRTLFYAIKPLYELKPASLQVALLVERMLKTFPIKADYVGFPIATTLKNHVEVSFDNKGVLAGAYLY